MTGSDEAAQIREDTAPEAQALHQVSSQEVLSGEREDCQRGEGAGGKTSGQAGHLQLKIHELYLTKSRGQRRCPPTTHVALQDTKNNSGRIPSTICVLLVT